jgi:hypothetical protein
MTSTAEPSSAPQPGFAPWWQDLDLLHAIDRAVMIFELDETGRVSSMNARLLCLLGLDAAAARGRRLVELMANTPETRDRCVALMACSRDERGWQGVLGCTSTNGAAG